MCRNAYEFQSRCFLKFTVRLYPNRIWEVPYRFSEFYEDGCAEERKTPRVFCWHGTNVTTNINGRFVWQKPLHWISLVVDDGGYQNGWRRYGRDKTDYFPLVRYF